MDDSISRRRFIQASSIIAGGMVSTSVMSAPRLQTTKGPSDYTIVHGHRDIYEFNKRLGDFGEQYPLKNSMLPRFLEGGLDVIIVPVSGTAPRHRGHNNKMIEGTLQVIDMLIREIEQCGGQAGIITDRSDIPTGPDPDRVLFFMDIEGAEPVTVNPETDVPDVRRLALLRSYYRLGVRGVQLTHNERNLVADGIGEGDDRGRLSNFGVSLVEEMNELGMMIGVSHLAASCLEHAAEITTDPLVSTHTNMTEFIDSDRQHSDAELKTIAATGGLVGIRYIGGTMTYPVLADQVAYMADLVGPEHIGLGWMGYDRGAVSPNLDPNLPSDHIQSQPMADKASYFIELLSERGFNDSEIGLVMGENYLRVWREILS